MRNDHFVKKVANVKCLFVFRVIRIAVVAVLLFDQQFGQKNIAQIGKMKAVFECD